jgi:hypothetical protein
MARLRAGGFSHAAKTRVHQRISNMFSRSQLQSILVEAGFEGIVYAFTGRRNGMCFDMEITGQKPQ